MSKLKIGWILSVDRNTASSRLQGYLIHEWLVRNNIDSHIVAANSCELKGLRDPRFYQIAKILYSENFTHIIFEGPEWVGFQISALCKLWGRITLCVRCDNLKADYDAYFDVTILPTKNLADSLGVSRRCIIPDCVEVASNQFKLDYSKKSPKLRVVWVGHQGYRDYLLELICRLMGNSFVNECVDFVLISKGDFATIQWNLDTVFCDVLSCDIAFIPIPVGEWYSGKSSNRLAMMMALGMPTIATPIPSYKSIAVAARDVLFVESDEEIIQSLMLLHSEDARKALGCSARNSLGDHFGVDVIAPIWLRAIKEAVNSENKMPVRKWGAKVLASLIGALSAIGRRN